MDNKEMGTPTITSLVLGDSPPNPDEQQQSVPSWKAPFLELLCLLKIVDNSQPKPKVDNQRFCFQPSRDLSKISRIFLSVTASDLQYDIDLKTIRPMSSDAVLPAVTKLQEYANNALRRIQQFKDCLLRHDIIDDHTCFLGVNMFTCPVCLDPLVSCLECDAKVSCTNAACLASLVVDCEQCFAHSRMACYDCLKKNDTVPPLICCPTCQTWCCREDSYWCAGLVLQPTLGSDELAELSRECEWDDETIVRSHPPKPSSCIFCHDQGFPPRWIKCINSSYTEMESDCCPSQTPFMTDHHLRSAFCPDCYEQSPGRHCACHSRWLCDMCFVVGNMSAEYPHFMICPRCGVGYCTFPGLACKGNIDMCDGCKGFTLCNDCQEEEELPGDAQKAQQVAKQVVLTEQCGVCDSWTCGDCSTAKGTARCVHCRDWFCRKCIDELDDLLGPCPFCGGPVCRECRRERRGCNGATIVWPILPPFLHHHLGAVAV